MATTPQFWRQLQSHHDHTIVSIRTNLEIGFAFADRALKSSDLPLAPARARARKAYDSCLQLISHTLLTAEELDGIEAALAQLQTALHELGEDV